MTITEIINALRCCADSSTGCSECPFVGKCIHTHADLKLAAVDAIQTLCGELATYHAKSIIDEKQIEDLQKQVNELIENETHSSVIKTMSRRIAELEAQMPKEGKWIQMNGHRYCSVCGHKDFPILMNYLQNWKRSCPYCGAKMMFNGKQKTESKNIKSSLEYDYCGTPKRRYDIEARNERVDDE